MRLVVIAAILFVTSCASTAPAPSSLAQAVAEALGSADVSFEHASATLNNDALPDAVVLVQGTDWCGSGGCTFLVLQGTPAGYALISRSTITTPPIRALQSSHFGWKDLIVHSNGTGEVLLQFDGTSYPSNPSLERGPSPEQLRSAQEILGQAPNNSFKPKPLRGSA